MKAMKKVAQMMAISAAALFSLVANSAQASTLPCIEIPGNPTMCVSNHGNLVKFESPAIPGPAGSEHLRVGAIGEGYAVCNAGSPVRFDAGFTESVGAAGWGASFCSNPGVLPIVCTRNTLANDWQLRQVFTRDLVNKRVIITMTLRNLVPTFRGAVYLSRYGDLDINNTPLLDRGSRTPVSAFQWEYIGPNARRVVELAGLTALYPRLTAIQTFAAWNPALAAGLGRSCNTASVPTPTAVAGDYVSRVTYYLGTFAPRGLAGSVKTVQFSYRAF
jgi:hypothetical protein